MTKQEIKYLLARLRTEAETSNSDQPTVLPPEIPEGFKESFENQKGFKGWINYHVTWDVHPDDPWMVVILRQSLEQEWHKELEGVVPVLTENGVVSAEEWAKKSRSTRIPE